MENTGDVQIRMSKYICVVCGWSDGKLLEDGEICPCCGTEWGYEDVSSTSVLNRREKWISSGYQWTSAHLRPANWSAEKQLQNISVFESPTKSTKTCFPMKIANGSDLIDVNITLGLEEISAEEISITDVFDIYDGPLSGMCLWRGEDFFFYSIDQLKKTDAPFPSIYILVRLDEDQLSCLEIEKQAYLNWQKSLNPVAGHPKEDTLHSGITIKYEQIIGWFNSVPNWPEKSHFLSSYFDWKTNAKRQ